MPILFPEGEHHGQKHFWGVDKGGTRWYFKKSNGIRFFHEWIAFEIGKRLELPVPEVQIAQMAGVCGVAIKEVKSLITYESNQFNDVVKSIQVEWELLATMAVFDILICNKDRAFYNWCFQQQSNGQFTIILLDHDDAFLGVDLFLNIKERDQQVNTSRCYSGYPDPFRKMAARWRESPLLQKAIQINWEEELKEQCVQMINLFPGITSILTRLVNRMFQLIRLRQERMISLQLEEHLYRCPHSCSVVPLKSPLIQLW